MEIDSAFIDEEKLLWDLDGDQRHNLSTMQANKSNKATQSHDQISSLAFDPTPPFNEVEDQVAPEADNKQGEWHYHLGQIVFDRLLLLQNW